MQKLHRNYRDCLGGKPFWAGDGVPSVDLRDVVPIGGIRRIGYSAVSPRQRHSAGTCHCVHAVRAH